MLVINHSTPYPPPKGGEISLAYLFFIVQILKQVQDDKILRNNFQPFNSSTFQLFNLSTPGLLHFVCNDRKNRSLYTTIYIKFCNKIVQTVKVLEKNADINITEKG